MGSKKGFFAMLARMKYINRWALMRNSYDENISEHSMEVAMLAHALAVVGNQRLGRDYDVEHVAMLGLYHDCTEIITGDMPTPVKYENPQIQAAYKQIEREAAFRLLNLLPEDIREAYEPFFVERPEDAGAHVIVKAADKLSALIKCIEEEKMGNQEFLKAKEAIEKTIHEMGCEEAEIFCDEFLPDYYRTLDEL